MALQSTWTIYARLTLMIPFILGISVSSAQIRVDFSVDKNSGCSPLSVSFTNRTTGVSANAIFKWDFGNGNVSTIQNPGSIYQEEKTFTATLTVIDGSQTASKSQQIVVNKKPIVDFTASTVKGCLPMPVTFTSTSGAGDGYITNYYWDFGDGFTQQSSSNSQSHSYNFVQKPSVSLTVTNNYGCNQTLRKDEILQVLPELKAEFDADKTILCLPSDQVKFSNASSGPGNLSYVWDYGDGQTSTEVAPSYSFNKRGIYTVKLTVNSSEGCTKTKTQSSYLNVATFNTDFSVPSLICKGNNVYIENKSSPTPNLINWKFDEIDNGYYGYYYTYYTYNVTGEHTIKLINRYGTCLDSTTKKITVYDVPDLKGFTADIQGVCGSPVAVKFNDTTPGAVKWHWTYDYIQTNAFSSQKSPVQTFNTDNNYWVNLAVTNAAGCTSFTSKSVFITKPYVGIISKNSSGTSERSSCGGFKMTFAISTSEELTDFKWVFSDGFTSTTAEVEHAFVNPGNYNVQLSYTTKNGCKGVAFYNNIIVYSKPKADFSATSTTICGTTPASFISSYNSQVTDWYWDFGDNTSYYNSSQLTNHIYNDEGLYTVKLIVVNGWCRDTMVRKDYIKVQGPFPKISATQNTCAGTRGEVTFTQSSRLTDTWKWDFGDGTTMNFTSNEPTIKHTYTKTGAYSVSLTNTKGLCSITDRVNVYVLLKQKPLLTATKTELCSSDQLNTQLSNLEPNPYPYNYTYYSHYYINQFEYSDRTNFQGYTSGNNMYWSTSYNASLSNFQKGKTDLRTIITSSFFGCADTSNYVPLKIKGPEAGFKIITNDVCWKSPIVFEDTSKSTNNVALKTWEWNFGDGVIQNVTKGGVTTHKYNNPNQYYITLNVTDVDGCSASTSVNYATYAIVNGPKAAFSSSGSNVPLNTTVSFYNYTNTYNSYPTEYKWMFGDGSTSIEYYPQYTYKVAGTYTVKLIATNAITKCSDTAEQVIVVRNFNSAFSTTTINTSINGCYPVLARFNNTSQGAVKVTWDFGDGTMADNNNNPSHIYAKPGVYKVTLYVYGYNGLTGTYIDSVIVKQPKVLVVADVLKGCAGQFVTLTTPELSMKSYTWDFGDGHIIKTTINTR